MRIGIHIVNLKNQQRSCHRTNFNSIFNISSYRNPKIQNDLPSISITKVKLICYFFHQNFDQKSLTMAILAF